LVAQKRQEGPRPKKTLDGKGTQKEKTRTKETLQASREKRNPRPLSTGKKKDKRQGSKGKTSTTQFNWNGIQ